MRFYDILLTRRVSTTTIFVVIERIYRYQFKSKYLKNNKDFGYFFCNFGIYMKFPMFWKIYEPHRSSFSEIIDSKRCACLNG